MDAEFFKVCRATRGNFGTGTNSRFQAALEEYDNACRKALRLNLHDWDANADSIWRFVFKEKWYGWDPPIHVHLYNKKSLEIIINNAGFKVEYLSSINRVDSLYAAIKHSYKNLINLKFVLRIIILPIQPLLKIFNLAPELLCIISKK